MSSLTSFELRKMIRKKSFAVGVVVLLLGSILLLVSAVSFESWTDENGKELKGLSAIALAKKQTHAEAGVLTEDRIAKVISRYHLVRSDKGNLNTSVEASEADLSNEAYGKYEQPDYKILSLIREAYSPLSEYDYYIVGKLKTGDAVEFYNKRLDKVNAYLNTDYTYGNYSAADKSYYMEMNSRIPEPFSFDYAEGWKNVLLNLWLIVFAIAFLVCICVSPVFAGEYESGADSIILSSRYGRSKVVASKLKASLILTTCIYVLGVLLFTLPTLGVYGLYGWNSSLQIIQLRAPFPLTLFQTYLCAVALGYLACLAVMAITLLLSSRMRTPFSVIIGSAILLFAPLLIPYSKNSRLFNHLLNLFPVKMMNGYSAFSHYELYHIFGYRMPEPYVLASVAVLIAVLFLPLAYRGFKKHQVA
ncbi:ABC transporter permease [Paenibacillus sp. HN-1]|uniref:ABC transporter permease subunit n=1 Tax=Paenibacillus TaxID=44249 RepID=UPI001CA82501|nr:MULTISPECIES: ABC transporter permease subunit [Paenibacillus]MBY9079639.1 ABC transporter permease [Paenibacillus sp. CGMCC 1.18879]MBY9084328.1 ABC transporter permease [Paenibacillus sinensis]